MSFCRTIAFALFSLLFTSQAFAACGPFPASKFLGDFTQAQVKSYVNKAYGGDWTPYLVALNNNLDQLKNVQRSNRGAVLKIQGKSTQVSAIDLAKYIYASKQWLAVSECLAEEQTMASLNDFSTAAGNASETQPSTGTTERQVSSRNIGASSVPVNNNATGVTKALIALKNEIASTGNDQINVEVTAVCKDGVTAFHVVNAGGTWPNTGIFSMFRLDGSNRQLISARRMQLQAGEAKIFRVSKKQNLTGEVGFAIEPSWYDREFKIDADAKCL